jgi:anti-sigma regulatory factor (Ser/Thr protein kinase)
VHRNSATERTQGEFAWRLDDGSRSIIPAREAFHAWLRQTTDDVELLEDMSVVLSELASNALDGAPTDAPGAEVRAEIDDRMLHLVVSNRLPDGAADIRHWDLDDPLRGGGRGLMIVRAYTDSLAVDSTGGAVQVRCTRRLDPAS